MQLQEKKGNLVSRGGHQFKKTKNKNKKQDKGNQEIFNFRCVKEIKGKKITPVEPRAAP
jgi:hypothetical protein